VRKTLLKRQDGREMAILIPITMYLGASLREKVDYVDETHVDFRETFLLGGFKKRGTV